MGVAGPPNWDQSVICFRVNPAQVVRGDAADGIGSMNHDPDGVVRDGNRLHLRLLLGRELTGHRTEGVAPSDAILKAPRAPSALRQHFDPLRAPQLFSRRLDDGIDRAGTGHHDLFQAGPVAACRPEDEQGEKENRAGDATDIHNHKAKGRRSGSVATIDAKPIKTSGRVTSAMRSIRRRMAGPSLHREAPPTARDRGISLAQILARVVRPPAQTMPASPGRRVYAIRHRAPTRRPERARSPSQPRPDRAGRAHQGSPLDDRQSAPCLPFYTRRSWPRVVTSPPRRGASLRDRGHPSEVRALLPAGWGPGCGCRSRDDPAASRTEWKDGRGIHTRCGWRTSTRSHRDDRHPASARVGTMAASANPRRPAPTGGSECPGEDFPWAVHPHR